MESYGSLECLGRFTQRKHFRHDTIAVFLIRDVRYSPKWTIEIERIKEFEPDNLPSGASHAHKWVREAKRLPRIV